MAKNETHESASHAATILAAGFLNLKRVQQRTEKPFEIKAESGEEPLADTSKTALTVHNG